MQTIFTILIDSQLCPKFKLSDQYSLEFQNFDWFLLFQSIFNWFLLLHSNFNILINWTFCHLNFNILIDSYFSLKFQLFDRFDILYTNFNTLINPLCRKISTFWSMPITFHSNFTTFWSIPTFHSNSTLGSIPSLNSFSLKFQQDAFYIDDIPRIMEPHLSKMFQEGSRAHLPNFSIVCALSNLVPLYIKVYWYSTAKWNCQ